MDYIWRDIFTVRAVEVDFNGRLKPSAVFELMQEAAEQSANSLGFGYEYVKKNNFFWVLSRVKLEIYRLPGQGEKIIIETWPKGASKAFAMRDFRIYQGDDLCMAATTAWLLLNGKTRSITRYKDFPGAGGVDAIKDPPPKLKPTSDFYDIYNRKVHISDLDLNNHVNNARYVAWAIDAMSYREYSTSLVQEIAVNYISELKYGDLVTIRKANFDNSNEVFIDAVNNSSGKQAIIARIRLNNCFTQATGCQ